jgi:exosortase A-associated hydrolase 2
LSRRAFQLPRAEPTADSWRFALYTPASAPLRGALLLLPPWAEELNKTRRALAQAVTAFAAAGFATLQMDLYGCGDSDGEFEDASWPLWQQDLQAGLAWLREQHPGMPLIAWALRAGALLAGPLAVDAQLWWQPATQGKNLLQQFLRLRLAAEMDGSGPKTTMAELKAELAAGGRVEVGGYWLSGALAQGLEAAKLQAPAQATLWLEASSQQTLLPASQNLIDSWAAPGLQAEALADPSPWAATELEDLPLLTQASLAWLQALR